MSDIDTDSSDSCELRRVFSVSESFDTVPKTIEFKMKFHIRRKKRIGLMYTLKAGLSLPYSTQLEGLY